MTSNPEEVTDEASKVRIPAPSNPVFNWPNRITGKDFAGWVEERGSTWMKSWDPHYEALLETHDEGQNRKRADCSMPSMEKESTCTTPTRSTGNCPKACRAPTGSSRISSACLRIRSADDSINNMITWAIAPD